MTSARRRSSESEPAAWWRRAPAPRCCWPPSSGSGIMGERLAGGNVAVALLANTLATGAALVALILTFGPISGAHFNPAVTLADASQGGLPWRDVPPYLAAQVLGAFGGVAAAHLMFGEPLYFASRHARAGRRPGLQRVRGDLRPAGRDLGLRAITVLGRTLRRRRLHHGGVLVHGVHLVRESGGHLGSLGERHLRGDPTGRCRRCSSWRSSRARGRPPHCSAGWCRRCRRSRQR